MDKKISIVTPYLSPKEYLEDFFNSCLKQTYQNIEIILIDNASNDGGWSEIQRFSKLDKRIRSFRFDVNKGAPYARNFAIYKALGDFVYFLDADDFFYDLHVLENLVTTISDDVHFIYGDAIKLDQQTQKMTHLNQRLEDYHDRILNIVNRCPLGCTALFRKSFFDYAMWDEADICCQEVNMMVSGVIRGAKYQYLPTPVVVAREHNSVNRITYKNQGKHRKKISELFLKFESELRTINNWDQKKAIFFSYQFCSMSTFLFRYAKDNKDQEIAFQLWKRVDKCQLRRSESFKFLSWVGISFLSNAWLAAKIWKLRDKITEFNQMFLKRQWFKNLSREHS